MAFLEFQSSILCTGLCRGNPLDNFRFLLSLRIRGGGAGAATAVAPTGVRHSLIAVNIAATEKTNILTIYGLSPTSHQILSLLGN